MDMFYQPGVTVPGMRWKFDETSLEQGFPVKVVNHSRSLHFTISFFQFETIYKIGKELRKHQHEPIPLADRNNRNLAPNTSKEFALPWEVVELDAQQARLWQTTSGVTKFKFALVFHDDYANADFPKNPKPLYPFRLRTEASRALGKL